MDWSGTSDFLSIDSDLDLGHARSLVGSLAPRFVVVRAEQASAAVRDDEDEQAPARSGFFVVDAGAISGLSGSTPMGATIGDFARERYAPALAIDTDDGWLAAEGTVGTGADVHAVLLDDDGIVTEVVPNLRIVDAAGHEPFDAPGVLPNQRWRHLHKAIADFVVPGITAFTVSGGGGVAAEDRGGGAPAAVPGVEDGEPMALEVHFADTVRLGDTAPLLVSLTLGAGGTGSAPITARSGELLEIMVSPTAGFTLVDEPVKKMTVVVDGETLPVKFDLLADVEGKGAAKVYVFSRGQIRGVARRVGLDRYHGGRGRRRRTDHGAVPRRSQGDRRPGSHGAPGVVARRPRAAVPTNVRRQPSDLRLRSQSARRRPEQVRPRRVPRDTGTERWPLVRKPRAHAARANRCRPLRVPRAAGSPRSALEERPRALFPRPDRGAVDPLGAVPNDGHPRWPYRVPWLPVRAVRHEPLAAGG